MDGHRGDGTYIKTSVSSATSGSTGTSDYKTYLPTQPYRVGSQAERGLMDKSQSKNSRVPSPSNGPGASVVGRPEMVEDHSAVIRYIQHDDEDDEPEEQDHAIWILVSTLPFDLLHHND